MAFHTLPNFTLTFLFIDFIFRLLFWHQKVPLTPPVFFLFGLRLKKTKKKHLKQKT